MIDIHYLLNLSPLQKAALVMLRRHVVLALLVFSSTTAAAQGNDLWRKSVEEQERQMASDPFVQKLRANTIRGKATVIDGRTIEINGIRIHLLGVDAPEPTQTCTNEAGQTYSCGQYAIRALSQWVENQTIKCIPVGLNKDAPAPLSAECLNGAFILNQQMLRDGYAVAGKDAHKYHLEAEASARAEKRGLWAGSFTPPDEYRNDNQAEKPAVDPLQRLRP
ncbi:thermonuclease family protein [Microvirga puerhi]|uniref:Thermonuclease family protein n=1 Tax=Microvirga puerhi TaxID=2876078 RepID=A0ABS7VNC9_9HYPH|nr:thermonuclease family protein [Microvirga puerhi]MBZ6077030.1 thermonuclease family protein [Microvirga puerhi]